MRRLLPGVLALVMSAPGVMAADSGGPSRAPYLDTGLPVDARVADLIPRLTLEEKATLLDHRGPTVERFGIRSDQWNQCLNGVQWDRPTTLFPACIAMAASWDTELVREIAGVLSDEARAIYNGWHLDPDAPGEHKGLIYRDPVINIGRNPYWGRNHEAFGEDPFLTGRMAVSYVRGLQGDDPRYLKIAATLKHYAVNNVEHGRTALNAEVSERMLREYWLPHFRDAVVEAKACSLMASYNAINGTPNNINRWLLTEVLKGDWKHQGFVVSDLGGVRTMVEGHEGGRMGYVDAVARSIMAGCDFSDKEYRTNIPAAVREGKLSEARLDDALARVLRVRMRLGEFDPFEAVPYSRIPPAVIGCAKHRAVALKAARRSIVLLQNRHELLPLDRGKLKRIAVIGPLADRVVTNNYNGRTGPVVTGLQGIRERAGAGVEVVSAPGCAVGGGASGVPTRVDEEAGFSGGRSVKLDAGEVGAWIEFAVDVPAAGKYVIGLAYKCFPSRGIYQLSIDGVDQGPPVDMFAARERFAVVADLGTRGFAGPGVHKFRFTGIGRNPAGSAFTGHFDKLTLAGAAGLDLEIEDLKFVTGRRDGSNRLDEAAEAARGADVAVVFVGTDAGVEQEGRDRSSLGLPGRQQELVEAVFAANPRTVVVEMSAGPLSVPWLAAKVPALLQAWWSGGEGGQAIAEVLFGEVNPAGRLPHTVYASEAQVPPQDEYDITRGFTYMYLNGEPLFAFGHGLSYTSFEYGKLSLSADRIAADGEVTVGVEVTNTGRRAGDEVVQLYVRQLEPSVKRPARELRGFRRISLEPGGSRSVEFTLPGGKLAFWDEGSHGFVVEPGGYEIMVGGSSADIRARGRVVVRQAADR